MSVVGQSVVGRSAAGRLHELRRCRGKAIEEKSRFLRCRQEVLFPYFKTDRKRITWPLVLLLLRTASPAGKSCLNFSKASCHCWGGGDAAGEGCSSSTLKDFWGHPCVSILRCVCGYERERTRECVCVCVPFLSSFPPGRRPLTCGKLYPFATGPRDLVTRACVRVSPPVFPHL